MQKQVRKPATEEVEETPDPPPPPADKGTELKATIDDLLDEIDGLLETNAEAFVKGYTQRGGQ